MFLQKLSKVILFLVCLYVFALPVFAGDDYLNLKGVGISKYAVLEVIKDYAPIRVAPDTEAIRYSELRKGIVLYADRQNNEYYRLDMGESRPFWIEKRYVEAQAVIPEKRPPKIEKVTFLEDKENYYIHIPADIQTAYKITETAHGLTFKLYDINYDKNIVEIAQKLTKSPDYKFSIMLNDNNSAVFNFNTFHNITGYDAIRCDDKVIFKIKKPFKVDYKKPLKNIKIALDAGHGGDELGVFANGFYEKDVNLQITKYLNKELRKRGAKTVLIRKKDKNTDLYKRIEIAKDKKTDLLISIHQNSLPDPSKYNLRHGVGVYYYNNQAKLLADAIKSSIVRQTGFRDDGVNHASFAITRTTYPVSVLVECGYLIHPYEAKMLTNKKFQKLMAKSIADGVESYLKALK